MGDPAPDGEGGNRTDGAEASKPKVSSSHRRGRARCTGAPRQWRVWGRRWTVPCALSSDATSPPYVACLACPEAACAEHRSRTRADASPWRRGCDAAVPSFPQLKVNFGGGLKIKLGAATAAAYGVKPATEARRGAKGAGRSGPCRRRVWQSSWIHMRNIWKTVDPRRSILMSARRCCSRTGHAGCAGCSALGAATLDCPGAGIGTDQRICLDCGCPRGSQAVAGPGSCQARCGGGWGERRGCGGGGGRGRAGGAGSAERQRAGAGAWWVVVVSRASDG